MSMEEQAPRHHDSEDESILHRLGYAQEPERWAFRNFAISFTIISILAGCLTSYNVGFEHGGRCGSRWLAARRLMATIISLAMAEIASAYPTAGGLYYWASKLGSPGWGWAMVQPHWPNRRHRGDRHGPRALRAGLFDWFSHRAHGRLVRRVVRRLDLHPVRDLPDRGSPGQHAEHPPDVRPEHDLGLVAHDRRRRHRRD